MPALSTFTHRFASPASPVQNRGRFLSMSDDDDDDGEEEEEEMQASANETEQASEYEPDEGAMDDPFQDSDVPEEEQESDSDESDPVVVKPRVLSRRSGRAKPMIILDSDEDEEDLLQST